ncbi:MAG: S-layer homology domain-containing protein, partial [Firmicutes bacterium]|nr:S-layer homology domain-containing protein [Bacillota bacterium]
VHNLFILFTKYSLVQKPCRTDTATSAAAIDITFIIPEDCDDYRVSFDAEDAVREAAESDEWSYVYTPGGSAYINIFVRNESSANYSYEDDSFKIDYADKEQLVMGYLSTVIDSSYTPDYGTPAVRRIADAAVWSLISSNLDTSVYSNKAGQVNMSLLDSWLTPLYKEYGCDTLYDYYVYYYNQTYGTSITSLDDISYSDFFTKVMNSGGGKNYSSQVPESDEKVADYLTRFFYNMCLKIKLDDSSYGYIPSYIDGTQEIPTPQTTEFDAAEVGGDATEGKLYRLGYNIDGNYTNNQYQLSPYGFDFSFSLVNTEMEIPPLEKYIMVGDSEETSAVMSLSEGDTVKYELKSTIPYGVDGYSNSEYLLTFHDHMDDAFSPDLDSVQVTVNGKTLPDELYEVTDKRNADDSGSVVTEDNTEGETEENTDSFDDADCTLEVALDLIEILGSVDDSDEPYFTSDDIGTAEIVVTYSVEADEITRAGVYQNTAALEYTTAGGTDYTETAQTDVITYGIEILKYMSGNSNLTLPNAEFVIYSDADCTEPVTDTLTTDWYGAAAYYGLDAGTYYIKEVTAPAGYLASEKIETVVLPDDDEDGDYIVGVEFSNEVDYPPLQKSFVNADGDSVTMSLSEGDTIEYELKSTIPYGVDGYLDSEYLLTFHDHMDDAFSPDLGSIQVAVNGKTLPEELYEVEDKRNADDSGSADTEDNTEGEAEENTDSFDDTGCTFEVALDLIKILGSVDDDNEPYFTSDDIGTAVVTVTYPVIVNEVKAGEYQNTAILEYSTSQSTSTYVASQLGYTEWQDTTVTTYGVKLFKYNENDDTIGLAEAVFGIYSDEDCKQSVTDSSGNAVELTTDADGYAYYYGLDAGTYYIKEVTAPTGYLLNDTVKTVVFPDDDNDGDYIVSVDFSNAPEPTATPTVAPTATTEVPEPTATPTVAPTPTTEVPEPTATPTVAPTPTTEVPEPTATPTVEPTPTASPSPTASSSSGGSSSASRKGSLTITKNVNGDSDGEYEDTEFTLDVTIGSSTVSYYVTGGSYDGYVKFTGGEAELTIKDGETLKIANVTYGKKYSVKETGFDADTFDAAYSDNASGTVASSLTEITVTNNVIVPMITAKPNDDGETSGETVLNIDDHYSYIVGYPDGSVQPEGYITRAEVATIFFRMLRDTERNASWSMTNNYPDVRDEDWYNNAVSTMTEFGSVQGYEDGTFRPNGHITRAELAVIAAGFFVADADDYTYSGRFSDINGDEWYAAYIEVSAAQGLVSGYEDGTFRPEEYVTRAEACTIINRTLGRNPDSEKLLPESVMITWPDNSDPSAWYYAEIQEATNCHGHDYNEGDEAETWTEKLEQRDWVQFERIWSDANSAEGGEVVDWDSLTIGR